MLAPAGLAHRVPRWTHRSEGAAPLESAMRALLWNLSSMSSESVPLVLGIGAQQARCSAPQAVKRSALRPAGITPQPDALTVVSGTPRAERMDPEA